MKERKQQKFDRIDKLIDLKLGKMEETLFNKMYLEISLHKNDGNTVTAMACEQVAIHDQIDLLEKMRIKVTNGKPENIVESVDRALYNQIQELEKQLS